MPVVVERIVEDCKLGEGPHWDVDTQSLYFVDVFDKSIHKYSPSTKKHTKAEIGGDTVSFVIPVEGTSDQFVISIGRQIGVVTWDGTSEKASDFRKITEVDTAAESRVNRLNDAKCDRSGRLWCGTMGPEPEALNIIPNRGSLFTVTSDGTVQTHVDRVSTSNGLAWNVDNSKMYYIDSGTGEVHGYDFDLQNGTISNKTVVFSLEEAGIDGFPDGQTIDTDGNLWVAIFNASRVIKIDPRKYNTLLQTVDIPAKQVTSVNFGGANLDELYVTSANITVGGVVLPKPDCGAIYKVSGLGVKGYPGVKAKIH